MATRQPNQPGWARALLACVYARPGHIAAGADETARPAGNGASSVERLAPPHRVSPLANLGDPADGARIARAHVMATPSTRTATRTAVNGLMNQRQTGDGTYDAWCADEAQIGSGHAGWRDRLVPAHGLGLSRSQARVTTRFSPTRRRPGRG